MEKHLLEIENILFNKAIKMEYPIIDEDLGVILLKANSYKNTNQEIYKEQCYKLFLKLIEDFEKHDFSKSFVHGFEGIFYVVYFMSENKIIDNEDILEELIPSLLESIDVDLKNSNFYFSHGCLGKSLYILSSKYFSYEFKNDFFKKLTDKLYECRFYKEGYITWNDKWIKKRIDFSSQMEILNFLLKIKRNNIESDNINFLINELIYVGENIKNLNVGVFIEDIFQDHYNKIDGIIYTVYYSKVVYSLLNYLAEHDNENKVLNEVIQDILLKISKYKIENSGIIYFEKEDFYDIGLNQGIGSIVYNLYRAKKIVKNNSLLNNLYNYWINLFLINTEKVIKLIKTNTEILLPEYIFQNEEKNYPYDKYSLFDGVLGVGFILSSILYEDDEWSEIITYN